MTDENVYTVYPQTQQPEEPAQPPAAPQQPQGGFNLGTLFTDPNLAEKGVWVDYFAGARLLLASTNSKSYKSELARLARKNKLRLDENNPAHYDAIMDITAEALSRKVLLGWENIHLPSEDGTIQYNVPYNTALGKLALMKSEDFKEFVLEQAGRVDNYRKEVLEEAKKP